ncbi:hypothetical protein [Billgrantia desiderata]|uniref:hypothetical protein n=1 Tax=Billgrantia desiderata TaxID=52021 RepID=UPI00089F6C0A|nr:hypothetical protein [Halomonas desiderata]SEG29785.1 hypothetical protein SAMN04487953_1229 [Halomonas desiderata]
MTYVERFRAAQARTGRLGLPVPTVSTTDARFLTGPGLSDLHALLTDLFSELSPKDLVAQCVSIHRATRADVSRVLGCDAVLTIGHVEMAEAVLFERSEEDYLANLEGTFLANLNQVHCWLTLPSMEIVDLTLVTSLAVIQQWDESYVGRPILRHGDELTGGMAYHPMLLGNAFFDEVGRRHGVWML